MIQNLSSSSVGLVVTKANYANKPEKYYTKLEKILDDQREVLSVNSTEFLKSIIRDQKIAFLNKPRVEGEFGSDLGIQNLLDSTQFEPQNTKITISDSSKVFVGDTIEAINSKIGSYKAELNRLDREDRLEAKFAKQNADEPIFYDLSYLK